jgi:tetratricopeptide (TPR) repeat protein
VFSELGDEYAALVATRMLAWAYYELGDQERARALHEDNLNRARALGMRILEAEILGAIAQYALDEGRVQDAVSMSAESLRINRDLGDRHGIATELCRCAGALAMAGKARTAIRLLASSEALHQEVGASMLPYLVAENERTLAEIRAQLDEAAIAEAWEQGRALTMEQAISLALSESNE